MCFSATKENEVDTRHRPGSWRSGKKFRQRKKRKVFDLRKSGTKGSPEKKSGGGEPPIQSDDPKGRVRTKPGPLLLTGKKRFVDWSAGQAGRKELAGIEKGKKGNTKKTVTLCKQGKKKKFPKLMLSPGGGCWWEEILVGGAEKGGGVGNWG